MEQCSFTVALKCPSLHSSDIDNAFKSNMKQTGVVKDDQI